MTYVDEGPLDGFLGATTVTTIHCLLGRSAVHHDAGDVVQRLLAMFNVVPVGSGVLVDAVSLDWSDFGDAVLHEAARHAGAAGIVTRDVGGFRGSRLPVYAPSELVSVIEALKPPDAT